MSTTTTDKRPLAEAELDATAMMLLFAGTYDRWEVAGSVRRRCRAVGDVDHVVVPRVADLPAPGDLFGRPERVNLFLRRADELLAAGELSKHLYADLRGGKPPSPRWGEKRRGVDFRGFAHELYVADPDWSNFGPTLAIRTGPADFSHHIVWQLQLNGRMNMGGYVWDKTRHLCRCGWSGPEGECRWVPWAKGKAIVKDPDGRDGGPFGALCPQCGQADGLLMPKVNVPTERAYFALARVPFMAPEQREGFTR